MECGITKSARKKGAVGNFKQSTIISAMSLQKGGGRGWRRKRRRRTKEKTEGKISVFLNNGLKFSKLEKNYKTYRFKRLHEHQTRRH